MSKSKHFIVCPYCEQKIDPKVVNKITKLNRKNNSTEFFDIDGQTEMDELIEYKLREKHIEFGVIPNSKRKEE